MRGLIVLILASLAVSLGAHQVVGQFMVLRVNSQQPKQVNPKLISEVVSDLGLEEVPARRFQSVGMTQPSKHTRSKHELHNRDLQAAMAADSPLYQLQQQQLPMRQPGGEQSVWFEGLAMDNCMNIYGRQSCILASTPLVDEPKIQLNRVMDSRYMSDKLDRIVTQMLSRGSNSNLNSNNNINIKSSQTNAGESVV